MKILVLGAGKMGSWLIESFVWIMKLQHLTVILPRLKYFFNTVKLVSHEEIREFNPDMVINAVIFRSPFPFSVKYFPILVKIAFLPILLR